MSFFGFDTTLPRLTKAELHQLGYNEDNEKFGSLGYAQDDDMEVYDFEGLGDALDDANDDETFGGTVDVGRDFDFTAGNAKIADTFKREEQLYAPHQSKNKQQPNIQAAPTEPVGLTWNEQGVINREEVVHNKVSNFVGVPLRMTQPIGPSVAEIEAQMQRDAMSQNVLQQGGPPHRSAIPPKMMSLEEVELMMMSGQTPTQPIQQPPIQSGVPFQSGRPTQMPSGLASLLGSSTRTQSIPYEAVTEREAMRAEKQKKLLEMSKYNNLMTKSDKDFITRVQISQLVTSDPYADDFYYQVYTSIRGRSRQHTQSSANQVNQLHSNNGRRVNRGRIDPVQKMQQQVQRIVNDAKKRPKMTQFSLEGALGKIALNSVRAPRQLLQVQPRPVTPEATSPKYAGYSVGMRSGEDRRRVLRSIENVYSWILQLEQLRRVQPQQSAPGDVNENIENEYRDILTKMWQDLRVMVPLTTIPHPFISMLSFSKGKRLIPRVLRYTNPEQTLTLLTMLVANLEALDVVKNAIHAPRGVPSKPVQDEIETFLNCIIPPVLGFVAEAPLRIMTGLLHLLMERNNIVWTARTKIGLSFYTMLLSRAEMIKGDESIAVDPNDIKQWQEVYGRLFSMLQGHFGTLFPVLPSAHQHSTSMQRVDDMYVWQFLAAVAVGASMEQQHALVTEVRDKVLENALAVKKVRPGDVEGNREASDKLTNVNLFLHALGLDSSQIA